MKSPSLDASNPEATNPACPFCALASAKQVDLTPVAPRDPTIYASLVGFMVGVVRSSQIREAKNPEASSIVPRGTCDDCKATMRKLVPSVDLS